MPTRKDEVQEKVTAQLAEMESSLKNTAPGVFELMEAIGQYDAAVQQAEDYLNLMDPKPQFSTSDRSS